jgi:DNA mismatch repair protein MutS
MTEKTKSANKITPLMNQYNAVKARYRDAVVFFRMGDFYEMFNEDARIGSRILGITLTSRGHGKAGNVPLAGFPHHALEGYLAKMIKAGYRVAICEQVEDPKLARGIVKRDVVQVVTPGTVMEEGLLETNRNNYLAALCLRDDHVGMAVCDVSTGEFTVTEFPLPKLEEQLRMVNPSEILVPSLQEQELFPGNSRDGQETLHTRLEDWIFGREYAEEILTRHFKTAGLKGFGCDHMDAGISACGAVLHYLQETQKTDLNHIRRLAPYSDADYMMLDTATRRNLEIHTSLIGGRREGTLLSILDRTRTPMGGRTLSSWLKRPLNRKAPVQRRLDAVEELVNGKGGRRKLREEFKTIGDVERLATKVVTRRATPRDIESLSGMLKRLPAFLEVLSGFSTNLLTDIRGEMNPCPEVTRKVDQALVENAPHQTGDGGFIREGYHKELDELRKLAFSGKDWIARLQAKQRKETGIPSLKVGYNKVFGYYIEVTKPHLAKVPDLYIRKQTLVNAERFITPRLKEMEEKILNAEEKIARLEARLFDELRDFVAEYAKTIQMNGNQLGVLDALLSLADVAEEYRYIKPDIYEDDRLIIREGRHPVVEQVLPPGEPFIPNDVEMDTRENQILIITGPNMAGKSTYIRQVGLIVLLAQIGSFVPAGSAEIGIVDRIFTRVGAQDNLAGGESTFLVEMNETANILNNSTPESLILLDEIGRGTSTFDGLSIAWAVAEYLHIKERVRARTLFATHYHELTELALVFPRVKNFNVQVKEWGDHIVFLRKIVPGGCDHSYGIQVARLAGLPREVIQRAKEVLRNLESNELTPNDLPKLALGKHAPMQVAQSQLNFFSREETSLRERLKDVDPDHLTPFEALQLIRELREIIKSKTL